MRFATPQYRTKSNYFAQHETKTNDQRKRSHLTHSASGFWYRILHFALLLYNVYIIHHSEQHATTRIIHWRIWAQYVSLIQPQNGFHCAKLIPLQICWWVAEVLVVHNSVMTTSRVVDIDMLRLSFTCIFPHFILIFICWCSKDCF